MPSGPSPLPEPSPSPATPEEREFDRLLSIAYALQSFRNLKSTGWMPDANGKTDPTAHTPFEPTKPKPE
jgi:hypothetical protein